VGKNGAMRLLAPLAALPLVLSLAACGGGDDQENPPAPTSAPAAVVTTTAPAAGASTTLLGTLGTASNGDAFEIGLTREDGSAVETLPAGTYTIKVDDRTAIHNWHLQGDGVDEQTGVGAKEVKEFTVTLTAGDYKFHCDPHPSMSGTVTVT
jgi:plastocyanin